MGCIMSLLKKKESFYEYIKRKTAEAEVNYVSRREETLKPMYDIISKHIRHLEQQFIENSKQKIIAAKSVPVRSVIVEKFDTNMTTIHIEGLTEYEFKHNISKMSLNDLITINNPRPIDITFKGYHITGHDLINFPSFDSLIQIIKQNEDLSEFTVKSVNVSIPNGNLGVGIAFSWED